MSISEIHARQIAPAVNVEIQLSFQIKNGVAARPPARLYSEARTWNSAMDERRPAPLGGRTWI